MAEKQGVMVPLMAKVCQSVDEIGLAWFLQGSSFEPVCLFISDTRPNDVGWWAFLRWIFRFHTGGRPAKYLTCVKVVPPPWCNPWIDGDAPLGSRAVPASAVCFIVDKLFSMEDACVSVRGSVGAPHSAPGVHSDNLRGDTAISCDEDDDEDDWDFADVPVHSLVDDPAGTRQQFDAICELCCSGNVAVLENVKEVMKCSLWHCRMWMLS